MRKHSTICFTSKRREIPIEVKDGNEQSSHSGKALTIQGVTDTGTENDMTHRYTGTVIIEEEDAKNIPKDPSARLAAGDVGNASILVAYPDISYSRPSAPRIDNAPDYSNNTTYHL